MDRKIKIFLIAGEASGDRLGAKLMREIKLGLPPGSVSFMGVGGKLMQAAGLKQIAEQKNFGIIGFLDVVLRFFQLAGLIKLLAEKAERASPDLLITIDSWDFCSRVVAKIKAAGELKNTRFMHCVSPSVWLYRRSRIATMKLLYDMLLVVFPFEARLYHEVNMPCQYIGHPIIEDFASKVADRQFKRKYNIASGIRILGAMVGSRPSEIARMLPIFVASIELFLKDTRGKFVVVWPAVDAAAAKLIEETPMKFDRIVVDTSKLSNDMRLSMLRSFDLALVKSGTSTLEVALARVPMVVAYKVDWFSAFVAKYIFRLNKKLKHVAMVNILLKEEAVREFVQERCDPSMIAEGLGKLMDSNIPKVFRGTDLVSSYECLKGTFGYVKPGVCDESEGGFLKDEGYRLLLKYQKLAKILSCDEKPSKLAADIVICLLHS